MKRGVRFDPEDERGFLDAKRQLLDRYAAEIQRGRSDVDMFVPSLMLEYRWGYGDGRILDWTRADVQDFLEHWLPRKASLDAQDIDTVPRDTAAFLAWLHREALLGGDPLAWLSAQVDASIHTFRASASDPSRRGFAGRLVAAMQADGIDPTDQAAMDRWIAEFNEGPIEERDRILGWGDGRQDRGLDGFDPDDVGESFPAVELVPESELAAAASEVTVLDRLGVVARFLAKRRKLTQKGHLNLADGRALAAELGVGFEQRYGDLAWPVRSSGEVAVLDQSFRWAKAAGFAKVRQGWASSTARGTAMGRRPHEDWLAAFRAWVDGKVATEHGFWTHDHLERVSQVLPLLLYRQGSVSVALVGDVAVELFDLEYGHDAVTMGGSDPRPWLREGVERSVLEPLVELGAITVADETVALTPLGVWGMNRSLRAQGRDAPVLGELADATAEELLVVCAERPLESSEAEIRRWIAARGDPGEAARALGAVAGDGGDLSLMAFHALGLVGEAAEPVVRELVDSPVRGQALVWLSQHDFADPATLPDDVLEAMMVSTFALTLDHEGGEALVQQLQDLGPEVEQIRWVESLARVQEPRVNDLLAAIGRWHPARTVAKAARTTLFRRKGLHLT